jgi:hypothetical protein
MSIANPECQFCGSKGLALNDEGFCSRICESMFETMAQFTDANLKLMRNSLYGKMGESRTNS